MAGIKLEINGIDEIENAINNIGENVDTIFKWALYDGMNEIIEELEKTIPKSLNPTGIKAQKHKRIDDGWETSATIGEGITKTGENTYKVLNILENGEHSPAMHKTPIAPRHYIKRAVQKAKQSGEKAMQNAFNEKMKEIAPQITD